MKKKEKPAGESDLFAADNLDGAVAWSQPSGHETI
jgi:hypothetical protein